MGRGDPKKGLLKAIIDVMNELGPDGCYHANHVTAELEKRGQWSDGRAKTPERTVNMYLTENPEVFSPHYGSEYSLRAAYRK